MLLGRLGLLDAQHDAFAVLSGLDVHSFSADVSRVPGGMDVSQVKGFTRERAVVFVYLDQAGVVVLDQLPEEFRGSGRHLVRITGTTVGAIRCRIFVRGKTSQKIVQEFFV